MNSSIIHSLRDRPYTTLATGVAIGVIAPKLPALTSFLYTNFLRSGNLKKYLHNGSTESSQSWAVVTGASDGIGFGFVMELAQRGFNVILHGRNKTKLEGCVRQLQGDFPDRKFEILVIDASDRSAFSALEDFVSDIQSRKLNLTVLINNVGGSGGMKSFERLESRNPTGIEKTIDMNVTFPVQITRALLPVLKAQKPSLIMNVGSAMSYQAMSYLSVYCGSKAFNMNFSDAVRLEMMADGLGKDVEVIGLVVGMVKTSGNSDAKTNFFVPDGRTLARHALQKVGCGKSVVSAYWPHSLQLGVSALFPASMIDSMLAEHGKVWLEWDAKKA